MPKASALRRRRGRNESLADAPQHAGFENVFSRHGFVEIRAVEALRGGSWVSMKEKPAEQYISAWKAKRGQFYAGPR